MSPHFKDQFSREPGDGTSSAASTGIDQTGTVEAMSQLCAIALIYRNTSSLLLIFHISTWFQAYSYFCIIVQGINLIVKAVQ